uniref:Protein kinase domain-containing protein n=1 Tax=Macrostomum lignano TaxID=282301 RepID=A0A1I8FCC8_9PLAT
SRAIKERTQINGANAFAAPPLPALNPASLRRRRTQPSPKNELNSAPAARHQLCERRQRRLGFGLNPQQPVAAAATSAEADDLGEELRQQPLAGQAVTTVPAVLLHRLRRSNSDGPDDTDDNRQLDNDKEASSDAGDDVDCRRREACRLRAARFSPAFAKALPLPAEVAGRPADELQELDVGSRRRYRASLILLAAEAHRARPRYLDANGFKQPPPAAVAEGDCKKSANAAATEVAAESSAAGEKIERPLTAQSDNNVGRRRRVNEAGAVSGDASDVKNTERVSATRPASEAGGSSANVGNDAPPLWLSMMSMAAVGGALGRIRTDSDQLGRWTALNWGCRRQRRSSRRTRPAARPPRPRKTAPTTLSLWEARKTDDDDEGKTASAGVACWASGAASRSFKREILFQCHRELQWVLSDEIVNIMRCRPRPSPRPFWTGCPGSEERAAAQGISSFSVDFDSEDTEADYQFVFGVAESVKVFYNYLAEETIRVGGSLHRFRELGRYHYLARSPAEALPAVSVDNLQQQQLSKQREALQQLEQQKETIEKRVSDMRNPTAGSELVPSLLKQQAAPGCPFPACWAPTARWSSSPSWLTLRQHLGGPPRVTTSSTVVDSTSAAAAAAAAASTDAEDLPAAASTAAAAVEESPRVPPVRSLSTQQPMVYQQQHQLQSMTLRTVFRLHRDGTSPATRQLPAAQPRRRSRSRGREQYRRRLRPANRAAPRTKTTMTKAAAAARGGGGGDSVGHEPDAFASLFVAAGVAAAADCWLVCQFEAAKNTLTFYQHHSDKHVTEDGGLSARCSLCDLMPTVRATVAKLIYRVNQLKLLEEMQTTLRCREMLVPAGQRRHRLAGSAAPASCRASAMPQIHQAPFSFIGHSSSRRIRSFPTSIGQQRREKSVALITGDFDAAAADNNSNKSDEASSDDEASREPAATHYEVRMEPGKFQCENANLPRPAACNRECECRQGSYNSVAILAEHLSYLSVPKAIEQPPPLPARHQLRPGASQTPPPPPRQHQPSPQPSVRIFRRPLRSIEQRQIRLQRQPAAAAAAARPSRPSEAASVGSQHGRSAPVSVRESDFRHAAGRLISRASRRLSPTFSACQSNGLLQANQAGARVHRQHERPRLDSIVLLKLSDLLSKDSVYK